MAGHRIGFVGTRFARTDGVSLESAKWAKLLGDHGHVSCWYGGLVDREEASSMRVPEAHFCHPDNERINQHILGVQRRSRDATKRILEISEFLKSTLYDFVEKFGIEILVVENALSLPMQVPLGVALTHFIAETDIPTIGHHHDFYWERNRFSVNAISDLLSMAFPPSLPSIQHVTINSTAQRDLSWRKGESSVLIPNVLDFENKPNGRDEYSSGFRKSIGLGAEDIVFLQPTRVVPRKGIEHSIALVSKLGDNRCKLLVSHEAGDEGYDYMVALRDMAEHEGVDLRFVHTHVGEVRTITHDGVKSYSLEDAYSEADFITYPSLYEGFGNALLEAFYFRKPVLVNRYSCFVSDIEPKGFKVITMDGYLTKEVIQNVRCAIVDDAYRTEMVNHNYDLGKAFFSYSVLRRKLRTLITNVTGLEEL